MIKRDINIYEKYNKPIANQRQVSKKGIIMVAGFLVIIVAIFGFWGIMNNKNNELQKQIDDDNAWISGAGTIGQAEVAYLLAQIQQLEGQNTPLQSAIAILSQNPKLTGKALSSISDFGTFAYAEEGEAQHAVVNDYSFKGTAITSNVVITAADHNTANRKLQQYIAKFDPEKNADARFNVNSAEYYFYEVVTDGTMRGSFDTEVNLMKWEVQLVFNYVKFVPSV